MSATIRVLHVDDEPDFADLTAEFLGREGFEVVTETAAGDALERLAGGSFDAVVSDYEMPGMDGLAFLEAVREDHPDLPFVLFTGKGGEEVASDAISLGVTDYLQKQPGVEQYAVLANRVRNAVAGHRAEKRAERQRNRFESLARTARVGVLVVDAESEIRFANPAMEDILGYEPSALRGEWLTELMPPRFRERHLDAIERYLDTGERRLDWDAVEFPGLHAAGHEVPLSISFGEFHQDGERFFTGIVRDASERRTRERDLRRYRTLVETVAEPMFLLDAEGRVTMANDAMAERLGYASEDLVGENVGAFMPEEEVERGNEVVRELLEDDGKRSATFETRALAGDGSTLHIEVGLTLLYEGGEFAGSAGVVRDLTERRRREEERDYRQSLFRAVVETTIDGVLVVDDDRELVAWNQQYLDMWDIPEELARTGEDQEVLHSVLDDLENPREFVEKVEYLYEHPDEESRDPIALEDGRVFDRYSAPVTAEDGTHYGRVWFFRDVTERHDRERAIEALHEVTRQFMQAETEERVAEIAVSAVRDALEMPMNTVWLVDEGAEVLRPVAWTDEVEELIGEPPSFGRGEGLAGSAFEAGESRAYGDVSAEPDRQNPDTPFRSELLLPLGDVGLLVAGATEPDAFDETDLALAEILASNAEAALERASHEAELKRQNDRLNEFASIVSHDLRNPLNVAEGRLQLARDEHGSEHHEQTARALERMRALIDDLLTLARQGEHVDAVEPVPLGDLVDACWDNVDTGGARLRVETDATVRADRNRLAQLLENLFRNAVEHGGDSVTVTLGDLDGGFFVEDDGVGIPEDERGDVFESGYTTGETGTGFGLSIVRQIVDAHGWEVRATDGRDGGARFEVRGVARVD